MIWPLQYSVEKARASFKYAHDRGFRVIQHFGDALTVCKHSRRVLLDNAKTLPSSVFGYITSGTPDCLCPDGSRGAHCNVVLDPMDPSNRAWFRAYMQALVRVFGDVVDGWVWDETFYIHSNDAAMNEAAGGYAAQAFLTLTEELSAIVHAANASKVFLTSDIIFDQALPIIAGGSPPNSMVADGNFADFEEQILYWPSYKVTQGRSNTNYI